MRTRDLHFTPLIKLLKTFGIKAIIKENIVHIFERFFLNLTFKHSKILIIKKLTFFTHIKCVPYFTQ